MYEYDQLKKTTTAQSARTHLVDYIGAKRNATRSDSGKGSTKP